MKQVISTSNAPSAIGPYSQAIKSGDSVKSGTMLFVSGQIPINPATGEMPTEIKEQAFQAIKNLEAILKEANLTLGNVVKTTVLLADMSLFAPMNEVYSQSFVAPYPARSAFAVKELPKGALIEIEAIAVY